MVEAQNRNRKEVLGQGSLKTQTQYKKEDKSIHMRKKAISSKHINIFGSFCLSK
jgi:hypothetical protein